MQRKLWRSDVRTIGQAVRWHRQHRGWTQAQLSFESSVSEGSLVRLEKENNTTLRSLLKLCKAMNVTLAELATLAGK